MINQSLCDIGGEVQLSCPAVQVCAYVCVCVFECVREKVTEKLNVRGGFYVGYGE